MAKLWRSLSALDRQIVQNVFAGLTSKESARAIGKDPKGNPLTHRQVDYRLEEICERVGARNRQEMAHKLTLSYFEFMQSEFSAEKPEFSAEPEAVKSV